MFASIVLAILVTQSAPAQTPIEKPWPPEGVVRLGDGVTAPAVLKDEKPKYPAAAMDANIAGDVEMEAVVQTDGTVGEVRVTTSLDRKFGIDDEAIRALRQWRFTPGKKDGVAVPVLVSVEMTFTLRRK